MQGGDGLELRQVDLVQACSVLCRIGKHHVFGAPLQAVVRHFATASRATAVVKDFKLCSMWWKRAHHSQHRARAAAAA